MSPHSDLAHSVHSLATASSARRNIALTARRAHSQSRLLKSIHAACSWAGESTRNARIAVLQRLQGPEIHEAA